MEFVKGPLNYTGSKWPIIQQLVYKIERAGDTKYFYDVMCGEGTVGTNSGVTYISFNDIQYQVIDVLRWIYHTSVTEQESAIRDIIGEFDLSRTNEQGYERLKEEYNTLMRSGGTIIQHEWLPPCLFLLIAHSFSNQIRFNSDGEFNLPFGRRWFNPSFAFKYRRWRDYIKTKVVHFSSQPFEDYVKSRIREAAAGQDSLFYFDPPYSVGLASYNEMLWSPEDDKKLLDLLDLLDREGIKWVLSNAYRNKGEENTALIEWVKDRAYYVTLLDHSYEGSNYQRGSGGTTEVLVANYD